MNVEKISARIESQRAALRGLPDPGDEPRPNRRAELEEKQRVLQAGIRELNRVKSRLARLDGWLVPFREWRDRLLGAREELRLKLEDAQRRVAAFHGHHSGREKLKREVDEWQQALAAVDNGWEWVVGLSAPSVPLRLAALLPGVDWTQAKPLPYLLVRIPELEKERSEVLKRAQV